MGWTVHKSGENISNVRKSASSRPAGGVRFGLLPADLSHSLA
jgi:hypothetical protein